MKGSKRVIRSTTIGLAFILSISLSVMTRAQGTQTAARPDRGLMPAGSYSISDIENISLTNGNLNLSIPLASLPPMAGGKLSLTIRATYNSKLWNVVRTENQLGTFAGCGSWVVDTPQLSDLGGWHIGGGGYGLYFRNAHEDFDYSVPNPPGSGQDCEANLTERGLLSNYQWYKLILVTPDGAEHEMRPIDKTAYEGYQGTRDYLKGYYRDTPDTTNQAMRYYSTDGTYLWAVMNPTSPTTGYSWTIYTADGTKITLSNGIQRITDNNGNSIKIYSDTEGAHYQDEQTGREIKITYSQTANNGKGQTRVWYQRVDGDWMHVDINHDTTHVQGKVYTVSDWNAGGGELGGGTPCFKQQELAEDVPVIRDIIFPETVPNQTPLHYSFNYNSDQTMTATDNIRWDCYTAKAPYTRTASKGTGELSQMITPTGATVNYTYNFDQTSYHQFDANDFARTKIISKAIAHDGTTDTWTYDIGNINATVTNPDGSSATETLYPTDSAWGVFLVGTGGGGGLVYRTNQSNKVVVERHWVLMPFSGANTQAPGGTMNFNPVVDAEYTTLLEPNGSGTPTPVKMSAKKFQYDYNGNLLETKEYDWVDITQIQVTRDAQGIPTDVPSGSVLLRTTTTGYYNSAASNSSAYVYAKRPLSNPAPLILNAPQETVTGSSQTHFSYDGQAYGYEPTLGNLTKVSQFDDQGDANSGNDRWLDTSTTYDSYGNKTSVTDPKNHVTYFEYDNPANGLVNRVKVNPLNGTGIQTTWIEYDLYTGLVKKQTDPNNNYSEVSYSNQLTGQIDPFGRPGMAYSPAVVVNGASQRRKVVTTYEDHLRRVTVAADLNAEGDGLLKSRTTADQLGRTKLVEQSEDGTSYTISSQTIYEQMGKIIYQSNPRRATADSMTGWTRSTKDIMGRVEEVATFSGEAQPPSSGINANCTGKVITSYYAQETTVTDQGGKSRKSVVDALGRLIKIFEDPQGLNYETSYSYDVLGNLTGVAQGAQTRTFTYNSMSRLAKAQNPESGTILYGYDPNGNLTERTDSRGLITSYGYDGLNRVTSRIYNDNGATPAVTYAYDTLSNGKGRLTSVSSTVSVTNYGSYDALGRIVSNSQVTNGNTYTFSYSYDLAGNLRSQTYPSGRVVETEYDSTGRIAGVKKQGGGYYAGGASADASNRLQYSAHGAITSMKLGNGLWEHTAFNSRLQPTEIGLGTSSTDSGKLQLGYAYGTTNNNGNLQSQTITAPGMSLTQSYTYDQLNRLKTFQETGGLNQTWNQIYSYDRYGNRNIDVAQTTNHQDFLGENPSFDPNNNRIDVNANPGYHYDSAGNLDQRPGGKQYVYDAENKQTSYKENNVEKGSYAYDGDGRRVKKTANGITTIFVYNALGQLIAEYGSDPINNGTQYLTADHLGSIRVVTDSSGVVKDRHDYLPFGEEIGSYVSGRANVGQQDYKVGDIRQKFTQKERDVETGLDYFNARYYSSLQGRFTSPDEFKGGPRELFNFTSMASSNPTFYADLSNPQSLNKYQYCINNPLRYIDPDGHKVRLTDEKDADRQEVKGRLLFNLAKNERKYFRIAYDKKTGQYILELKGNVDKALSKNHTAAFGYLVQTIRQQDTIRVEMSETSTDIYGKTERVIAGTTLPREVSQSGEVEVYLSREIRTPQGNPILVDGKNGGLISAPKSIVAGHEVLGHARLLLLNQDSEHAAIDVENELRRGRGLPERAYDSRP
jgi:RHS repeat-associated protein